MLTQCVVPVVGGMLAEQYYLSDSWLCSASSVLPSLPRAYFLVVLVNAVVSSVLVVFQGFAVGVKRSDCIAKAKKDGDEHAEERYAYPKLYAEGFSKVAREFNCYQRSHQQAYETYPQFLVLSMLGGITFPITTAVFGAFWCYSRKVWAEGKCKKLHMD
jgi:hypothetical protein